MNGIRGSSGGRVEGVVMEACYAVVGHLEVWLVLVTCTPETY